MVQELWPASSKAWAQGTVERESHGIATAQNPTSSAAGCFGMTKRHTFRFERHGYTWNDRYNARANVIAALDLYEEAGTNPW